jgi:hypothetical protein
MEGADALAARHERRTVCGDAQLRDPDDSGDCAGRDCPLPAAATWRSPVSLLEVKGERIRVRQMNDACHLVEAE